jgi:hypothetical protein
LIENISITLVSKRRASRLAHLNSTAILFTPRNQVPPPKESIAGAGESPLVDKLTGFGAGCHSSWVTWAKILVVC